MFINTTREEASIPSILRSPPELLRQFAPPFYTEEYKQIALGRGTPDPFANPLRMMGMEGPVLVSTLHVMADRLFKVKDNLQLYRKFGLVREHGDLPHGRTELYYLVDVFYNRCIHSMFHPTERMRALMQPYLDELGDGIRIGIHIRMGNGHADWKDSRAFMDQKHVNRFLGVLKKFVENVKWKAKGQMGVKLFLSTDSSDEEALLRKRFPGMVVTTTGFQRSHVGGIFKAKVTEDAVTKAVLDVLLLGECDYLYLTPRSGFSKIGQYFAEEGTPAVYLWRVCCKLFFVVLVGWTTIICSSNRTSSVLLKLFTPILLRSRPCGNES